MKRSKSDKIVTIILFIIISFLLFHIFQKKAPQSVVEEEIFHVYSEEELKDRFYYRQLNETQQRIYSLIERESLQFHSTVKLNHVKREDMTIATYALGMDCPQLFWLNQFTFQTINQDYVIEMNFIIPSNAKETLAEIDLMAAQIMDKMNVDNEYDKIKYFYDWIIEHTEYGEREHSQDIRSVFLDHESVCAGYAKAFQYLCQRSHIECTYVSGYTKDKQKHAWNLVKLSGQYYWVDTTWGDPVYAKEQDNDTNYNYFMVEDEELFQTHIIEPTVEMMSDYPVNKVFTYPECQDNSLNYYRLNHIYFEQYDYKTISQYFRKKFQQNIYQDIELKFGSEIEFNRFLNHYLAKTDARIYDDINAINPFFYGTVFVQYVTVAETNYIKVNVEFQ